MTYTIIVTDYIRDMREAVEFDSEAEAFEFILDYSDNFVSIDLFVDGVYTPYDLRFGGVILNPADGEITLEDFDEAMDKFEDFCDDVDESNYDPYAGCDMYDFEPMDWDW